MFELPGAVAAALHLLLGKTAFLALWFALFFLAERLHPAAAVKLSEPRARRLGRNAVLAAANAALSPLAVVPLSLWAAGHALVARPPWWGGPWALALDLVALDLLLYGWHRLNHEWALLWRFHAVHHLDRTLDATTALRFHCGEVLLAALARMGVIVVLAVPFASILAFETMVLAATIFHHSNLRLPPPLERALGRIVVTPAIHWVHHHRLEADTQSNYATVLSAWDRVFRSRSPRPRSLAMEIGVEGRDELGVAALFLAPFQGRGSVQAKSLGSSAPP